MLRNYLKIAWRNIVKDKSITAINLLGLAFGLAITMLIVHYVRYELSYEDNYPKSDRIVRLTTDIINGESVVSQDCETNPPLARLLVDQISEVSNGTRAYPLGEPSVTIEVDERQFIAEKVFAVDSSFFDMFSIPLIVGKKEGIMTREREVVLSEATALKYFNTIDVLDKTIKFVGFDVKDGDKLTLKVAGVVPNSPSNTHLKFDILLSYPTMLSDLSEREDNWGGNNTLTYVELSPNASYENFTKNLIKFNEGLIEKKIISDKRFIGQKIGDIHLYSKKGFETEPNGEARLVYLLLLVAFLVIVSALVNYVNLTTSKAMDRAREMGMRKAVGSTKSQIQTQVFIESFMMNLLAGILAILVIALIQGIFIETAGLPSNFSLFKDSFFWVYLVGFLMLNIIFSGIYPALVLSSFVPSRVLKGSFSHSKKGILLRKSLVVFQFSITVILLVQAFAVHHQLKFLRNAELGVDTKQTIVIRTPYGNDVSKNYAVFKQSLLSQSQVKSVSTSTAVPGSPQTAFSTTTGINLSNTQVETNFNFNLTQIDTAYFGLMDIRFLAGENFNANSLPGFGDGSDNNREVIVNEEAIRIWGIPSAQEALGQEISFFGSRWNIKGVVKNYSQFSPKSPQLPIIHVYTASEQEHISIKFQAGESNEQLALVKSQFESYFAGKPFQFFFLDTAYDEQYKAEERFQKVFGAMTLFAIFIACLGLFGLATFTVIKRTKEIGIRKSIGASTFNVLMLLSKDFLRTVLISILIGIPIAYYLVKMWLANFANHMEISWWLFALPSALLMLLVIISIGGKTISTALMNPVKSLKSE